MAKLIYVGKNLKATLVGSDLQKINNIEHIQISKGNREHRDLMELL